MDVKKINEESDTESSSSSVDEEIKLSQNFICVLEKISSNSKNYDDYILLLDIANDLNDLDKIRQSIELFSKEFPLSPEIWLRYLKTESCIAQSEKELEKLIKLHKRALSDYYSVDIALEFANLTLSQVCSDEQAKEIWNDLLPAYGYDFTKGRLIWLAWRNDYMKREGIDSIEDKVRKVFKKFKEELLLPLHDMQLTYIEFRTFLEKYEDLLEKPFEHKLQAFEIEIKNTKKILQKVTPFEKKLSELEERAHNERIEVFKSYIDECADDLEEEFVQVLYERMTTSCCLNENVWKLYIDYIQNRSPEWRPLESNKSKIFQQTDLDIVNRALQNCNWSASLYVEKMRILETNKEPKEKIQNVLEQATQIEYKSAEPLVKVWIEYLTYLSRITNFKEESDVEILRKNFNLAWNTLGWQYGNLADCDCEILKFWGRIEYSRMNDYNQGKQLWNTVMESNENGLKTGLWIEFAELEHRYKNADAARLILKRALKINDLNDTTTIASYWIRFERCHGTLEQLKYCKEVCDKALKHYNKKQFGYNRLKSIANPKKDNKRKADDQIPQKNKKIKEENTIVSKEEFQKLSISKHQQTMEEYGRDVDEAKDNVSIFLSNLDVTVSVDDLRETFPEITFVNFKMITRGKGRNGFGYAELSSEIDVVKALELDRRLLGGRPVFISRCERDKTHRSHGFKYSTNLEPNKIFVKGLSYSAETEDLQKLFSEVGKILDIRIVMNKFGKKKGCAYIEFEEEKSAKQAVFKLDQIEFMGKTITVAISEPPKSSLNPVANVGAVPRALVPRNEQKSRISLIPASLQKSNLSSASLANKPAMSNDDFRKLVSK